MNQSTRNRKKTKRQRVRRMQAYAARAVFVAIIVLTVLILLKAGKGAYRFVRSFTEDKTAISGNYIRISKNGSVQETAVEDFDPSVYDETGLKEMIDTEISAYNDKVGEKDAVKLSKLTIKNNVAKLVIDYSTVEDYTSFSGIEIKLEDASETVMPSKLTEVDDGKIIAAENAKSEVQGTAVLTKSDITIMAPKKIKYYGDNIVMIDSKTAKVTAGETDAVIIY